MKTGELEKYRKLARDPKNKYVEWADVDAISGGYIDGRYFVYDCDCKKVAAYEHFIWNNRHGIAAYLKERAKIERGACRRDRTSRRVGKHGKRSACLTLNVCKFA